MIPRHSLPCGIREILSALVSPMPNCQSPDIEKAYADALGVTAVALLPSVRAGIYLTIRAAGGSGAMAVAPAYTCETVHEALVLTEARARFIDSAPESFLMSPEEIGAAAEPGCVLVLSEVYGIPYDLKILRAAYNDRPSVRILDMAMSIPSPERIKQLETTDVALFSFGWGKPLYAGWGGIACIQDPALAERVRGIRDEWITQESPGLQLRSCFSTLLQVVMNQRLLYGLSHEPRLYRVYRKETSSRHEQICQHEESGSSLAPQWTRPMTTLNRKLALHNLCGARQNADLRRRQAEVYSRLLVESGIVHGSGSEALPQSHFPVRFPSALRDRMCDYLRARGIDTSTLFAFPARLSRSLYPHAAKAADEVVTLPLGPTITLDEIKTVSECIKDGLGVLCR